MMTASSGHAARRYSPERGSARPHQPVLITVAEPGWPRRAGAPAGSVSASFRSDAHMLTALLDYPVEDVDSPGRDLERLGLVVVVLLVVRDRRDASVSLRGLVAGVGQADVDGVVQVEPLAVPGRDDRARRDVGVVAAVDGAARLRQRRADLDHRAVRPVEREGAVAGCGDQVAAFVDQRVVVLAQADQVIQRGPAAVGPVLDVVQVDPAGLAAGEPAAARVAFAGRAAQ